MKRSTLVVAFAAVLATLVAATAAFAAGPNGKVLFRYTGELDRQVVLVGDRLRRERQPPGAPLLLGKSQVETFATGDKTVFLRWSAGIPTKVGIDALNVGDTVTVNVRARSRVVVRGDRCDGRRHRRRPRRQPDEADPAAVSLPRHVRLGRGRQGDDRRQGRQPPRAAPDDRSGHDAVLHDRRRDGVPPLGAPRSRPWSTRRA